jgi:hypothetical protein
MVQTAAGAPSPRLAEWARRSGASAPRTMLSVGTRPGTISPALGLPAPELARAADRGALGAARQARGPRGREHLVHWRFAGNPGTIERVAGPGLAHRRPMRQRPNRAAPVSPSWQPATPAVPRWPRRRVRTGRIHASPVECHPLDEAAPFP